MATPLSARFGWLMMLLPATAFCQTARITGRITDPSDRVIRGALIVVSDPATFQQRRAESGEEGYYTVPLLKPGIYDLSVAHPGFQTSILSGITLSVNEIARLDFTLSLAVAREQLTVHAQNSGLDRETASLGGVVHGRNVLELPLLGRNPYALGMLVTGVRTAVGMNNLVTDVSSTSAVSIDGGRNNMNSFLLDGAPNTSALLNQPVIFANPDSVQEFKVETNTFSAEYGRAAGGIFNVVTRSGTNDLHFTAYEFLRNRVLNANDSFANSAGQHQPFRLNQFGGVIGGAVRHNRTFFFVSTELVRFAQGVTFTATVPNASQLSGDFSQLVNAQGQAVTIYDPLTTHRDPNAGGYVRMPFPGNVIPPGWIDPVASKMSRYWPAPNISGTDVNNFIRTDANRIERNSYSERVDHFFDAATQSFVRYSYDGTTGIAAPPFGPGSIGSPQRGPQEFLRHNVMAELDRIITADFLAMLRLSFARLTNFRKPLSYGFDITTLGFPAALHNALSPPPSFPSTLISGYAVSASVPNATTGTTLGDSGIIANVSNDYTLAVSATRNLARHSVKFGGEARRIELNIASNTANLAFSFSSRYTEGPVPLLPGNNTGSSLAAFLLGVTSPVQGFGAGGAFTAPSLAINYQYRALYVEDMWKLSKNLTFTLGIRYDYESPRRDRFNQLTNFDFRAVPPVDVPNVRGALSFVGVNGASRYQSEPDHNNFAPRVGIAWSPFRKTVLRAGGGIFYAPTTGISGTTSLFGISSFQAATAMTTSLDGGITPTTFLRDPFPQGLNRPTGSSVGSATLLGQDIAFYDRRNVVPYTGQWNFDIQRELPGGALLDVAYAGARGVKFPADKVLNQLPDPVLTLRTALSLPVTNPFFGTTQVGPLSAPTVAAAQLLRPYPQFGQITSTSSGWSGSRYHALHAKFEKRLSGLGVAAAYTYSKTMDDSSGVLVGGEVFSNGGVQDWNNLRSDWSTSVLDQTHRFILSGIYEWSFWKRTKGLADLLLSGWETGAIVSVFTGSPLSINTATDNSNSMGGRQRPNWTGRSAALPDPSPEMWFDTLQFSQPAAYAFGNAPRTLNGLRSDGGRNVDLGVNKKFVIKEKWKVQFRSEVFNLLNRVQYAPPNTMQGSRGFGVVSAMQNQPRILQFGLKLIY